jgi:4-amino-4-deoxy-L-arabinose transferase-like glycosyltransferase
VLFQTSEKNKERIYLALLTIAGPLRFVHLGFKDLQAWDEALYAVRSEGILRFGHLIDQSSYAIDGLYSALHPPLYIWLTALSFHVFGISEFSARLFSAVLGALTLFLIYRIGKRIGNSEIGFLAALLYGLNPFVTFYARQGQFDSALVFFLTLSVYLLLEHSSANEAGRFIRAGISVGAALMTKLFVGLGIPLAYALSIFFTAPADRSKATNNLGTMILMAALVALPWHIFMTVVHGHGNPLFFFTASSLWQRTLAGVEGNTKPLELLYYVNQLLVLFPVGVVWMSLGLWNTLRSRDSRWSLLALWFLVFFVVFSVIRTKLAVYLLPMLIPASLFAAKEMRKAVNGEMGSRLLSTLAAGTLFSILWSSNQEWRNSVKAVIVSIATLHPPEGSVFLSLFPFILTALLIVGMVFLLSRFELSRPHHQAILPIVVVSMFLFCFYQVGYVDTIQWNDGARELSQFIVARNIDRVVVAGYERNPQLSYYLDGADIGWRSDVEFRRIIPPKDATTFRPWLLAETMREPASTLLIIEKDKFIRYVTIDAHVVVPPDFELVFESRRYACFRREKLVHMASDAK